MNKQMVPEVPGVPDPPRPDPPRPDPLETPDPPQPSDPDLVGASILPFTIDTTFGNTYFLLAKERFVEGWRGSQTWSDFGGRRENGEAAEACAAREFHEETMAMVPVTPLENTLSDAALIARGARRDTHVVARGLAAGGFTLRVNVTSETGTYTTFVKQVPWRPGCQDTFQTVLRKANSGRLGTTHAACMADGVVPDAFLEKTCVRLWSVAQLRRLVTDTRRRRGPERLRWGFHERLGAILDQFPGNSMFARKPAGCGPGGPGCGQGGTRISLETYGKQ